VTLTQLRCLCAVIDQGLHLSRAAQLLNTSQPAVTKMIRALEQEFGFEILMRSGPRIVAVTEAGQEVIARARQVLLDVDNLKLAASDSNRQSVGVLRIASTPLCAEQVLCEKIQDFTRRFPEVDVSLMVGMSADISRWTSSAEVDVGIGTLPEAVPANLFRLDAYTISRSIVAPPGHPILEIKKPTLKDIGSYPLITHHSWTTTGQLLDRMFANAGIIPKVILKANAENIVKTYVSAGMGIAIMQTIAISKDDPSLQSVNIDHLFPPSKCWIVLRRDLYIRRFLHEFIAMISPKWVTAEVNRARSLPALDSNGQASTGI
jgi:Transcriptional regulator